MDESNTSSSVEEQESGAPSPKRADTTAHDRSSLHLTDQTNLLPFRKIIACFSGLSLCIVVSTLDTVIVATSIPTISAAFKAGSIVSWVPSAYLLTSTSFQPLYGRFSDIFGRKAAICVAMLVFMVGNLLAGFSRTIIQLIVFRGIAGAGGGGIISMSQIVISDIVSLRDRGKYQGIIGGVVALGYTIGPIIGGALSQKVSWRWCFWICIPVSLFAMAVVVFILPLKPVSGDIRRKLFAVDFIGAILTLAGCALLLLPLIWGGITFPWTSAVVLAPLFSGILVAGLFCIWEWKGARLPIVPMYIFKHSTVTGVYITMFVNGFVYYSALYYLPQYFQVVLGYDPIGAGTFLIPILVSQMAFSWISGVMVSRTGRYRTIVHSGFAIWSVACGLISTITPRSHKVELVIFMLLAGCGAGQTLQTTTVAAQASVSRKDMSVVTAFRNFIRLLGGTLALAVDSTIINNSLRAAMNNAALPSSTITSVIDNPAQLTNPTSLGIPNTIASFILNEGYTKGFRTVFIVNASLTALATVASIVMIKHKELTRGDEEQLKQDRYKMTDKTQIAESGSERKIDGNEDAAHLSISEVRRQVETGTSPVKQ
ncbi:MFS general substrate transporter [Gymnopilus junonius]|uniref:MFS general substrate transporter n=1 Tax=Gymnopilus junonius TaxID=109634 RepID=A0A9P5NIL4_GYMJU|nr:MFS general substrate transporter [Gymnopilus junonius]